MPGLFLDDVTKIFPGGVRAVDGVSLEIADREFVVLVGPSGCGKTTTLRLVAGLEDLSSGTIRIGDRVVNDVPPRDRDIAMVFQNYALYPHMTVFRNMAFGLQVRTMPGIFRRFVHPVQTRKIKAQIRQRVLSAAQSLGIEELLDRKPRALSGGQKQRVALGRAIVREPAAFLFDEPLSNFDAKLRVTTRAELKRLHQRIRTTTLYVTHDQEEAMTLGDRIVVMRNGKIQQADTPLRTYNRPSNRFVAGFIGMPPMNFFDGAIRAVESQLLFEEGRLAGTRPAVATGKKIEDEPVPKGGGELTLPDTGFRLVVPAHLKDALAAHIGKHVVLGIRPEHLSLQATGDAGSHVRLEATLNVIEPLGRDMDLFVETSLHDRVVARVESRDDLAAGTSLKLYADLRKVHFFEPGETGMNLSLKNEPTDAIA